VTRRRKRVLTGAAVPTLAAGLRSPSVRWPLVGWWRGEAFYHNGPTSDCAPKARCLTPCIGRPPASGPPRAELLQVSGRNYWSIRHLAAVAVARAGLAAKAAGRRPGLAPRRFR
jgi:hypothetical protein